MSTALQALAESKATTSVYGLSKISGATDVTEDLGLVLSAKEKNPAVDGTLANKIRKNENKVDKFIRMEGKSFILSNGSAMILHFEPDESGVSCRLQIEKNGSLTMWRSTDNNQTFVPRTIFGGF